MLLQVLKDRVLRMVGLSELISSDTPNALEVGSDGKLKATGGEGSDPASLISEDEGNQLRLGNDDRLYVPPGGGGGGSGREAIRVSLHGAEATDRLLAVVHSSANLDGLSVILDPSGDFTATVLYWASPWEMEDPPVELGTIEMVGEVFSSIDLTGNSVIQGSILGLEVSESSKFKHGEASFLLLSQAEQEGLFPVVLDCTVTNDIDDVNHDVNIPECEEGDLLIALIATEGSNSDANGSPSWFVVNHSQYYEPDTGIGLSILSKIATGGEGPTFAFSYNQGSASSINAVAIVLRIQEGTFHPDYWYNGDEILRDNWNDVADIPQFDAWIRGDLKQLFLAVFAGVTDSGIMYPFSHPIYNVGVDGSNNLKLRVAGVEHEWDYTPGGEWWLIGTVPGDTWQMAILGNQVTPGE